MSKQIFLNHLKKFEAELSKFGYLRGEESMESSASYRDNITINFKNIFIQRDIKLIAYLWNDGELMLNMIMYKVPHDGTYFNLTRFLVGRNIKNHLTSRLPSGGDASIFIKKYFDDLALLFNNELSDQITGESFENHYDKLMASMNEY